ncbi:hypothetical protein ACTXT7_010732, partial [Hymenolepis weldensis]
MTSTLRYTAEEELDVKNRVALRQQEENYLATSLSDNSIRKFHNPLLRMLYTPCSNLIPDMT